jgi:hypothetical protein
MASDDRARVDCRRESSRKTGGAMVHVTRVGIACDSASLGALSASGLRAAVKCTAANGRNVPCVDASRWQGFSLTVVRGWLVQPCVRPVGAALHRRWPCVDVYGPRRIATSFGRFRVWRSQLLTYIRLPECGSKISAPRASMEFRSLPPHWLLGISRSYAGPHTRFRKRRCDRFTI